MNAVVSAWLLDAGIVLMAVALAMAAVFAALLIAVPGFALRIADAMAMQISPKGTGQRLTFRTERFFYRHHRALGGLLLLAVTLFFVLYLFDFPRDSLFAALAVRIGDAPAGVLLDALERFFVIANALAGVLAIIVILRPSLLKPLETRLNAWVTAGRTLEKIHLQGEGLDRLVRRWPRTSGLLILLGVTWITTGLFVSVR